jgi:hypothetical protein
MGSKKTCGFVNRTISAQGTKRRETAGRCDRPCDLPADLLKEKPEIRFDGDRVSIRLGKYKIEF